MDNLLTALVLQKLNLGLNHNIQRAVAETALPEIDYSLLSAPTRSRTERPGRKASLEHSGLATPAGLCCM
jgi:hypothetical protein